jgi:hypothetical protein
LNTPVELPFASDFFPDWRRISTQKGDRRAVGDAKGNPDAIADARLRVDNAKVALGERGPVRWTDGEPDLNRRLVKHTPYADWFAQLLK